MEKNYGDLGSFRAASNSDTGSLLTAHSEVTGNKFGCHVSKRAEENQMKTKSPLDLIKIAAPCGADWNAMRGTDSRRFCTMCRMNVYNIANMTREEAEDLFFENEGRICVRLYRRDDGTVMTENCPVGIRKLKQKVSRFASAAFGLVAGFMTGMFGSSNLSLAFGEVTESEIASVEPRVVKIAAESPNVEDGVIAFGGGVSNSTEVQLAILMTRKFPAGKDD